MTRFACVGLDDQPERRMHNHLFAAERVMSVHTRIKVKY